MRRSRGCVWGFLRGCGLRTQLEELKRGQQGGKASEGIRVKHTLTCTGVQTKAQVLHTWPFGFPHKP